MSILCQISLGVKQWLQKVPKFDINDIRILFYCYILIPRKCPRKTPFKTQCPPPQNADVIYGRPLTRIQRLLFVWALETVQMCRRSMWRTPLSIPFFPRWVKPSALHRLIIFRNLFFLHHLRNNVWTKLLHTWQYCRIGWKG